MIRKMHGLVKEKEDVATDSKKKDVLASQLLKKRSPTIIKK